MNPALRAFKQKARRAHGEQGQDLVEVALVARGFKMIEAVHTPWRVIRKMGRIVGAFPVKKVSGDFRAVTTGGVSVLVEVKGRDGRNVPWSAFEDHQREALSDHAACGGISLVACVRDGEIKFYDWPVPGFGPGKSLPV